MYIDEVGNSDLGASDDPNHRFLSLTGVIFGLEYVAATLHPTIEELKVKYFQAHPDEPLIFHRREMMRGKHPFEKLRDEQVREEFDSELLTLLRDLEYSVITVVIDKLEHKKQYDTWRFDPYHYCLTILAERFVRWLERKNAMGDVMAESRGGREDRRLKDSFSNLYKTGTDHIAPERLQKWLTSCQLKVKPKANNISGLQIADILAYPSYKSMRRVRDELDTMDDFGGRIVTILEHDKYQRRPDGKIDGWGRKWLP